MYYRILFVQLFSVIICSQDLGDADVPTFWNQISKRNTNSEEHSDAMKDKIQLKVYYETLCPASIQFFVEQLTPAVKRLGTHLDVHLIPYGHATTTRNDDRYLFRCQHGAQECYCNKIHACAVDVLRNNTHAILFNDCLMQQAPCSSDYKHFRSAIRSCGRTENVHIYDIWQCMNGTRSSDLLKAYGDETHVVKPTYVPYVELDGSSEDQDSILGNLFATVCQKLTPKPPVCLD